MKNNLNNKGFTLIEIMLVIAVVGILAIATVPKYHSVTDHYHLESSSQIIVNRVAFAKQMAMSERKNIAVCVTNNSVQLYPVVLTGGIPSIDTASVMDHQSQIFDGGINRFGTVGTWPSVMGDYVYFDWRGFLKTNPPGTSPVFTLINLRNQKINVNINIGIGNATLSRP